MEDVLPLKGIKIIWVEDDKFLGRMVSERMVKTGASPEVVSDGAKAFDAVKNTMPHIVVLDLLVPNVDGFEILRRMKADPTTSSIPVVILSNLGQKEEIDRSKELGADDFLVKATVGLDEIVPRIQLVLSAKKAKK